MPTVLKSGSLNLLEPSGPLQACNGIALRFSFLWRYSDDGFTARTATRFFDVSKLVAASIVSVSLDHVDGDVCVGIFLYN